MEVGQKVPFLYKLSGQSFTVEAEIISLNGRHIQIEFISPTSGVVHRRWLRSAADRARLLDYTVPRRGAPDGNQNATKAGPTRQLVTISYAGDRLARASHLLAGNISRKALRELTVTAIDAYLESRSL